MRPRFSVPVSHRPRFSFQSVTILVILVYVNYYFWLHRTC